MGYSPWGRKESDMTERLLSLLRSNSNQNMWSNPYVGFAGGAVVKDLPANVGDARDMGLISGGGRFPGKRNGYLLQYSCLENSMDREAWQVTVHGMAKSWKWLSD